MEFVINKLIINGKEFALISDIHPVEKNKYYGTISWDDIDENLKLKRRLNGFDMCVAPSIEEAINFRKDQLNFDFREKELEKLIKEI